MTSIRCKSVLLGAALMLGLTLGSGHASAQTASIASSAPLSQKPVFCYGADEFDRCQLYFGTEQACKSLNPC